MSGENPPDLGLIVRQQRQLLDEMVAMRSEIRAEIGRLSGRVSIMDRRLAGISGSLRTGLDTAADLQNQIDVLTTRIDQLEGHSP